MQDEGGAEKIVENPMRKGIWRKLDPQNESKVPKEP